MLMLLRQRRGLLYLLRATFSTDIAAPLPASLPVDVGGPLTVVQVDGQFSQSGGKLNFPAQATPVWGDQSWIDTTPRTRVAGLSMFGKLTYTTKGFVWLGWNNDLTPGDGLGGDIISGFITSSADIFFANTAVNLGTYSIAIEYQVATVLRAAGSLLYIKGGVYATWTLLWVGNASITSPVYAAFSNHSAAGTLDEPYVAFLPAFATDALVYTNRLVAPAAGATTTSTADAWIEHTISTLPSADAVRLRVRKQDASNYWRVEATSAGAISLIETVATVDTSRGSVAAVVASGHRIVVVQQGTVIKVYSNNVLRITYSSATNFQTATAVELNTLGTGGVVSEVVAWPLYPTGLPA